jgi:hypothetical protein
LESVTFTPRLYGPGTFGVPVTWPEELKLMPAGSTPPLCENVYEPVPPDALTEPL